MDVAIQISVIVPVYNVEKYLEKCIESIIQQREYCHELILVNDGSTDLSKEICEVYGEKYDFIKVITKINEGPSEARNCGIKVATGNFLAFIDGDDYIAKDYLKTLTRLIYENDADIAVVGIMRFIEGQVVNDNIGIGKVLNLSGLEALECMLYQQFIDTSVCGVLVRKSLAKSFLFPYGKYHEDDFVIYNYYVNAKKVSISTRKKYFYLKRPHSIMHTLGQPVLDEIEAADNLVIQCQSKWPQLENAAVSKKFSSYCQVILRTENFNDNKELYKKVKKFLHITKWRIVFDKRVRIKNRVAGISLVFGIRGLMYLNYIYTKAKNILWRA